VRHLTGVAHRGPETSERVTTTLADVARKVRELGQRHPYLHGDQTIFGNMPDWNPAEIVGVRPRPLAMSLYRELVTDSIWAYQRDNYGYRNLRSFPLLVSLAGLPYIDVRVSFNSFLPKDLDQDLAERLSSYYIDRLRENPSNHDKVEFEIIYTCYTLDLPSRLRPLLGYGFSDLDLERLTGSLRRLTNRIIHGETGLWRGDIAKLEQLEQRFDAILGSGLDGVAKIYWLLEDCKRYGTLPFAGLARAGFIAVQLLRSLVAVGIFDSGDYDAFMSSLDTISSRMARDLAELNNPAFLRKYGYLRPGTYDIRSPRYDEAKDRYFDWSSRSEAPQSKRQTFQLSLDQLRRTERLLKEHGLEQDLLGLFDFIKAAIEGREYAKFVFSRSLSEALTLFRELGAEHGLSLEDCSFVDICTIARLYGSSADPCRLLVKSAEEGREAYAITCRVVLPPLITGPDDVYRFELPPTAPNFITQKGASGPVTTTASPREALHGSVLLIPSADPGYDWVFSHGIGAFVTMYGGVNSHMAIRAAELGIPAVIGAGQTRFDRWVKAEILEIDCANRQVRVVQ
jgi:phosphohistidine swiveling domain-containing protein